MWSKKPTPVSRVPAPVPERPSVSETSVSPVLRCSWAVRVTGGFEHELTEEFLRAVASAAKATVHVDVEAGANAHHMIEACFKAFARALRIAVSIDPDEAGVPSTKGTLT